ncbi:helix-turn-helix transcriptional regulator [Marinactinospora rubrisoli]|uniref:Helix-turn-helix transcriptional regulator n=1 Tax=Marinactinospora rubrisoli TaxID=2715399 RepID=A0ABW2KNF1_9ACTN
MSSHGTSPVLVGRATELRALLDHAHAARAGRAGTLLLCGDAGVGKSRLLREFAEHLDGGPVVAGGCLELGVDGLPFAPFVTVLRQLLRELGREHLTELVAGGGRELARLLPELGEPPGEHREARNRLFEQVLRVLDGAAEPAGLTVVLEDLHWADAATRDLLVFLVRNLDTARVQIVASYRSDDLHRSHPLRRLLPELERLPTVSQLTLRPLSLEEVAQQAAAIRRSELAPEQVAALYERTAGNPLFVESFLDSCVLEDILDSPVPSQPRELLLAGVDRLPEQARSVVRMASVGAVDGDHVGHALLAHVARLDPDELDDALSSAVNANILRVDGQGYRFRHALLREAVHQELLPGAHARLHLRFAEALEARPGLVPADRLAAEQAHHFHAAQELPRALSAAWWAAVRAGEALAFAEQLRMLERVLELWERVPEAGKLVATDRVKVLEYAVAAALECGEFRRGRELADLALSLLPDSDDTGTRTVRAVILRYRGRIRIQLGHDDAMADLLAALDLHPPEHHGYGWLLAIIARELMLRGGTLPAERLTGGTIALDTAHDRLTAAEVATEALARSTEHGDLCAVSDALITRGTVHGEAGDTEAGAESMRRGITLAEQVHEPELELRGIGNLSSLLRDNGRHREALDLTARGLERAREVSMLRSKGAFIALNRAEILFELGELQEAARIIDAALSWSPAPLHASLLKVLRGRIALLHGDQDTVAALLAELRTNGVLLTSRVQSVVSLAMLTMEAALAEGAVWPAVDTALRTFERIDVRAGACYRWEFSNLAARTLSLSRGAPADTPDRAGRAAELRRRLVDFYPTITSEGPARTAHRDMVRARIAAFDGAGPAALTEAWERAVASTAGTEYRLARADALLHAADAAANHGDRALAAERLRAAADIAKELGAVQVERRTADLARRLGLSLDASASAPPSPPAGLTARETEVLRLLAHGYTNAQIAAELFISAKTASVHVSHILAKLGLPNRGQAAARAHELGLA